VVPPQAIGTIAAVVEWDAEPGVKPLDECL
jgi:hypothetical protein